LNKPDYISKPDWDLVLKEYDEEFVINKLQENYPIQYLIGNVDFYGSQINVNENVLIPRFETELLVENTIRLLKEKNINNPKILDIGTGSGCIAITLAKNINSIVEAIDISPKAIEVAKSNALLNRVNINFKIKDILKDNLEDKYDLIISNPPYIKKGDLVDPQTKYEPQNALFAEHEGLIFYEEIIKKSVGHLNKNGILAFEIGMEQALSIKEIAKKYYPNSDFVIAQDYTNRDRMVFIHNIK